MTLREKFTPAVLATLEECAHGYLNLPSRPLTGPRGRYLERLGLVEYSEHVDHLTAKRNLTMVKSYCPTEYGLRVCVESGDPVIAVAAREEIERRRIFVVTPRISTGGVG